MEALDKTDEVEKLLVDKSSQNSLELPVMEDGPMPENSFPAGPVITPDDHINEVVKDTIELVKEMDDIERSKYVKLFNSESTTILGIQHPRVKNLAKQKVMKIPSFSLQSKQYPPYVTLKARQFTKMSSTASHGASNTAPGFCTSVVLKRLSPETKTLVGKLFNIEDEDLLSTDTEELDDDYVISQENTQSSQSQGDTLRCCTHCEFTSRSRQEFQDHLGSHPKCKHCNKVFKSQEILLEHEKIHETKKCEQCEMEVLISNLQGHLENHEMTSSYRNGLKENKNKKKTAASKNPVKLNSFILFCRNHREEKKKLFPQLNMLGINQKLREHWHSLSQEEKNGYKDSLVEEVAQGSQVRENQTTNIQVDAGESQARIHKCQHCGRMFLNQEALNSHISQNHPEMLSADEAEANSIDNGGTPEESGPVEMLDSGVTETVEEDLEQDIYQSRNMAGPSTLNSPSKPSKDSKE